MRKPVRRGAWWYEVLAKPVVTQHSESERMWVTDIIPPRRRNPGRNVPVFSDSITIYRLNSFDWVSYFPPLCLRFLVFFFFSQNFFFFTDLHNDQ